MYVKIVDGSPVKVSRSELTKANPNVSFPRNPSDASLSEFGYANLHLGQKPSLDVVEEGPIELVNGVWTQTYTGRNLTPDEKRQNMVVTMRQARLALLEINKLSLVDDAIALIPEPDHSKIKVEWEYASTVERTSPWMSTMGSALGLSDTELDQLFETAKNL